eukprot:COSAG03_NODE_15299_length_435_cov_0.770833_1_plen_113_part_10
MTSWPHVSQPCRRELGSSPQTSSFAARARVARREQLENETAGSRSSSNLKPCNGRMMLRNSVCLLAGAAGLAAAPTPEVRTLSPTTFPLARARTGHSLSSQLRSLWTWRFLRL